MGRLSNRYRSRRTALFAFCAAVSMALGGCRSPDSEPALTLATTTSTRDSGLLDELIPLFEKQSGIEVRVVAVGTGQALALGRRGDADVLLTHAPEAERQFVADGFGEKRILVMANDFVLVGPDSFKRHFQGLQDVVAVFRRIAEHRLPFVSRGDQSGTHIKELALWQEAGVKPGGPWYLQSGSGMAQTLRVANEKRAMTLADRSTFLAQHRHLELEVLFEKDRKLRNPYAVIVVNPAKHPHAHVEAARKFAAFLVSPDVQQRIARFGIERYGEPLFFTEP